MNKFIVSGVIAAVIIIVGIVGLRFVEDTGQKKEDTSIC